MQQYIYPPTYATVSNPSIGANSAPIPSSSNQIGFEDPSGNLAPGHVDGSGNILVSSATLAPGSATAANQVLEIADLDALNARTAGALVSVRFDEIDLTYITSGNGTGSIGTAVYKLASSTVKTLTLTYDASNRLSTVVAS